jgi:hypothetical protein
MAIAYLLACEVERRVLDAVGGVHLHPPRVEQHPHHVREAPICISEEIQGSQPKALHSAVYRTQKRPIGMWTMELCYQNRNLTYDLCQSRSSINLPRSLDLIAFHATPGLCCIWLITQTST